MGGSGGGSGWGEWWEEEWWGEEWWGGGGRESPLPDSTM